MARSKWLVNSSVSRFPTRHRKSISDPLFFSLHERENSLLTAWQFPPFWTRPKHQLPSLEPANKNSLCELYATPDFSPVCSHVARKFSTQVRDTCVALEIRFSDVSSTSFCRLFDSYSFLRYGLRTCLFFNWNFCLSSVRTEVTIEFWIFSRID